MHVPDYFPRLYLLLVIVVLAPFLGSCGGRALSKPDLEICHREPVRQIATSFPVWLGNAHRNFYGTGPLQDGPLEIVWQRETELMSGALHPDPWGGTSWPGQPSFDGKRVYFPSADGNIYCLNAEDGSTIWRFKGKDSFKSTPTLAGDRVIASGLDHHVYCLNAQDGSLVWD